MPIDDERTLRSRRELVMMIIMATALLSVGLFAVVREAWTDGWLLYDGRPGSGLVIEKRSHGHRLYQYKVERQLYTGDDQPLNNANEPELPYETMVYFSDSRPWISGLRTGDVRVGFVPLFLMVLIAWSLFVTGWFAGWRGDDNAALRLWLPVDRSWWAVAAGYMGLFAMYSVPVIADVYEELPGCLAAFTLICLPAPLAVVFGAAAVADLRRHPKLHGWGRAVFGLLMGTIFTIVLIVAMASFALGRI